MVDWIVLEIQPEYIILRRDPSKLCRREDRSREMFQRIDKNKLSKGKDDDFDIDISDPTLSACCVRDLEDRKQAAAWKSELRALDPVQRKVDAFQGRAGIFDETSEGCCHPTQNITKGIFEEADTCNVVGFSKAGEFVICLASERDRPSEFVDKIKEWLEGSDAILLEHRYSSSSCRDCIVDDNVSLPALIVYGNSKRLLTLDRRRLESESESSLHSRLSLLKREMEQSNKSNASLAMDHDDGATRISEAEEGTKSTRNHFYKCDRDGCSRTFYHVHVKTNQKNQEFNNDIDLVPGRKRNDSWDN